MVIKKYCLFIWKLADAIYFHFTRLQYIKNNHGEKMILRVRLVKYKGRDIVLLDGTSINKNDILIKIHLHNVKLLSQCYRSNDIKKALILYHSIFEALPHIRRYLLLQENQSEIKGLVGITMLHRGCRKLGFEPITIQNQYYKLFKQIALFLIHLLASNNRLNKCVPEPMYLFMSKKCLLEKYKCN